jgi:predicted MPP superfamily phosphohydrolase
MTKFLLTVLGIWAAMHAFVFWRVSSVPWIRAHCPLWAIWVAALLLWASYPLARIFEARGWDRLGLPLEYFAANWIGTLFLLFALLLVLEVLSIPAWAWRAHLPVARGWTAVAALVLAVIALIQGMRPPVIRDYEVRMPGLPADRDGLVVVHLSDLHLGTLIGQRWLAELVSRVNALKPDIILMVGDVIDGNAQRVVPLVTELSKLNAPLGVFAVTGNHEYYAGLEASIAVLRAAGFHVLRGESVEAAPGLVIAGVDDVTVRMRSGFPDTDISNALTGRPPGATILLSHTPWNMTEAAQLGANLMVSGHTHNGQIWPFTYLVKARYPHVSGQYEINGMSLVVGIGAGTWGPRMRLWRPGEIVRITLRSAPVASIGKPTNQ